MIELMYRAFEAFSYFIKKPSLLHSGSFDELFILIFYIDDFFGGFTSFEEQYEFLQYHFLF